MKKTTLQIASENNKKLLDNLIPSKSLPIYAHSFDGANDEIYNKSFKQIREEANSEKRNSKIKIYEKRFSPDNEKEFIKELKEELQYIGMTANDFSKSIFLTEAKGKSIFRHSSFFDENHLEIIKKRFGIELKKQNHEQ